MFNKTHKKCNGNCNPCTCGHKHNHHEEEGNIFSSTHERISAPRMDIIPYNIPYDDPSQELTDQEIAEVNEMIAKGPSVVHPAAIMPDEDHMFKLERSFGFMQFPEDGYYVDGVNITNYDGKRTPCGGVITAIALQKDDPDVKNPKAVTAHTNIINTENAGMRYVRINSDGTCCDLGPVIDTCFIGNGTRPEGLYVPLANIEAVDDATRILTGHYKSTADCGFIVLNPKDVKKIDY